MFVDPVLHQIQFYKINFQSSFIKRAVLLHASLLFAGVEFLMPVAAFFCSLCDEFSGDVICAEDHLKTEKHDTNYRVMVSW